MSDRREGRPDPMPSTGKVWISFVLLACSLAVLAITPALVSIRTRALRNEITEIAEPTIAAASGIERSVGLQMSALRGYVLTGDGAFLDQYRRLDDEERESARRLVVLADELGPEVARHAERLLSLAARWDETAEAAVAQADPSAVERLVSAGAMPSELLTEARTLRRSVELVQRMRRADIATTERVEVWVNLAMVALAATAGIFLVVIGRRLHALRLEAEARQADLRRSQDRRARLMRGLSHDLKNPLGAAAAHAEFLEMEVKGPLREAQKESVKAIRRSIETTVRLVEDLLHLARAERGELPVDPVSVDFGSLVAEVAEEARMEAKKRGLVLEVARVRAPVRGRTDPARVREVLQNLLSNAMRYTPSGGTISVGVEEVGAPPDEPGRVIRVSVSDTGPGIAPPDQERVFREFERMGSDDVEGTGLGLAISRQIARLLGGDIELRSEPGKGATFVLVLPARPELGEAA